MFLCLSFSPVVVLCCCKVTNYFQKHLVNDIASLKSSQNMIIPADKTTNLYDVEIDNYKKLIQDNITATYQKTEDSTVAKINKETKAIASKLKLDNRIEHSPTQKAFITLKDHKLNFVKNSKCHLINPTKSEIGMISTNCLDKINKVILKESAESNLCDRLRRGRPSSAYSSVKIDQTDALIKENRCITINEFAES